MPQMFPKLFNQSRMIWGNFWLRRQIESPYLFWNPQRKQNFAELWIWDRTQNCGDAEDICLGFPVSHLQTTWSIAVLWTRTPPVDNSLCSDCRWAQLSMFNPSGDSSRDRPACWVRVSLAVLMNLCVGGAPTHLDSCRVRRVQTDTSKTS